MWLDLPQGEDSWFNARLKIPTSSNFAKIMAHHDTKKPKFGDPAITYARQKATERITGVRNTSGGFFNKNMERGNLLEPLAIRNYERETLYTVTNGGIFLSDGITYPLCGDSPDGLIGSKGCLEVKTVIENTQWKRLEEGKYDTAYKWQIQGHMLLGNRDWCDFCQYCPEMPEGSQLYIHRVYRDEGMIDRLKNRLRDFEDLIVSKERIIKCA